MFDRKYLVHILVADNSDTYYMDCGLQMGLNQRIWLELQKDFGQVCFLRNSSDGPRVYDKNGAVLEDFTKSPWPKNREEVLRSKLFKKLKESAPSEKTAVVAELGTFTELMKGKEEGLWKLSTVAPGDRGILILLVPQSVDGALPYLVGPGSLFEGENTGLCSRLHYLQQQDSELFCSLKNCDQVTFLSELTHKTCRDLIINAQLEQTEWFLDQKELSDCAELLYRLCTCPGLRKSMGMMRELSAEPKFQELFDWLRRGRNLRRLYDQAQELLKNGQTVTEALDRLGHQPLRPQLIRRSDPLIRDICAIAYPPDWCPEDGSPLGHQLRDVQNYIYFPRTIPQNQQIALWMRDLFSKYQEALDMEEPDYLKNTLRILCYAGRKLYLAKGAEKDLLESRKTLFSDWILLTRELAQERKRLESMVYTLNENASESLYYQTREQQETVRNLEDLYQDATGTMIPLLNDTGEISTQQVTQILQRLKNLTQEKKEQKAQIQQTQQIPEPPAQGSNQLVSAEHKPPKTVEKKPLDAETLARQKKRREELMRQRWSE